MERRDFIRAAVAIPAVGLAGCGGDSGGEQTPRSTPTDSSPSPSSTAGETPTSTPTETPTPTATATPIDAAQVVDVGPGSFRFDPDDFEIGVGETVAWVWRSSNHNVVPNETPDAAEWDGSEGGEGTTFDEGHVHRYTFDVAGEYSYYCAPHRSAGMTGSFTALD